MHSFTHRMAGHRLFGIAIGAVGAVVGLSLIAPRYCEANARSDPGPTVPALRTCYAAPIPPPIAGHWTLMLNDEFARVDQDRWVHRYWWNGDTFWPTDELQVFRRANVTANGVLSLTARRESGLTNFMGATTNRVGETFCCSSGLVSSGGIKDIAPVGYSFTYGYAEARIWIPSGAGTLPRFWMQRADHIDNAEIDVMEVLGSDPNTLQMHYHGPEGTFGGSYTALSPLSDGWHRYAIHWEPGRLTWYLDGIPQFTHTGGDVDSHAHYVMFDLAIGGSESWGGPPDENTPFPSSMHVDWLRVWQRARGGGAQ